MLLAIGPPWSGTRGDMGVFFGTKSGRSPYGIHCFDGDGELVAVGSRGKRVADPELVCACDINVI